MRATFTAIVIGLSLFAAAVSVGPLTSTGSRAICRSDLKANDRAGHARTARIGTFNAFGQARRSPATPVFAALSAGQRVNE